MGLDDTRLPGTARRRRNPANLPVLEQEVRVVALSVKEDSKLVVKGNGTGP